jgi:hypothetical protein
MMLCVKDISFIAYFSGDHLGDIKLLAQPQGHGLQPGSESLGGDCEVAHKKALKCKKGLIIKSHIVQIPCRYACLIEAEKNRISRKPGIVFFSRVPFLLSRRQDFTVPDKAGRAVMVKARYT